MHYFTLSHLPLSLPSSFHVEGGGSQDRHNSFLLYNDHADFTDLTNAKATVVVVVFPSFIETKEQQKKSNGLREFYPE